MFDYFKRLPHCLHFQKSNRIHLEKLSSGLARANRRSCSWRPHRSPVLWGKPPWRRSLLIPPPCTLWSWRSGPPRCPPPLLQHWPAGSHPSGDPRLLLFHTKLSVYAGQGRDFELTEVQMFFFLSLKMETLCNCFHEEVSDVYRDLISRTEHLEPSVAQFLIYLP